MKKLAASLLALCLCLSTSLALAGDPGDTQSGLDRFNMGMSRADAKKMGAVPAGENTMKASITWADARWDVLLTFKQGEVVSVALSTADLTNPLVYTFLQDMEERLYVPFLISRNDGSKEDTVIMIKAPLAEKNKDERDEIMVKQLDDYAGQENGTIMIMFCGTDDFDSMAEELKKTGNEDAALEKCADDFFYAMHMDKKTDHLTLIFSSLRTMNDSQ